MDGYEFLRHSRQLPAAAYAPAFALTGYGQESDGNARAKRAIRIISSNRWTWR
jgi:CheY-like chemotaxis protein